MIRIAVASSVLAFGLLLTPVAQAMDSMEKPMHKSKSMTHMKKPMAHEDGAMKSDMQGDMKGDAMKATRRRSS